jgi:hypothetical protein
MNNRNKRRGPYRVVIDAPDPHPFKVYVKDSSYQNMLKAGANAAWIGKYLTKMFEEPITESAAAQLGLELVCENADRDRHHDK